MTSSGTSGKHSLFFMASFVRTLEDLEKSLHHRFLGGVAGAHPVTALVQNLQREGQMLDPFLSYVVERTYFIPVGFA